MISDLTVALVRFLLLVLIRIICLSLGWEVAKYHGVDLGLWAVLLISMLLAPYIRRKMQRHIRDAARGSREGNGQAPPGILNAR
jgi:hypothetical protein